MIDVDRAGSASHPEPQGGWHAAGPNAKLFGIGLSRTGTTSLHVAAVLMGMSAVHYPLCYRDLALYWLNGDFRPTHTAPFRCYTDLPTPCFFRELDRSHPGSKFVLTLRDESEWVDSIQRQHARPQAPSPRAALRQRIRAVCYGDVGLDRARYLDVYRRHHDSVREYFARRLGSLLVLDITRDSDAWNRLAGFLGKEVAPRPFPHLRDPDLGNLSWVLDAELPAKSDRLRRLADTGREA